MKAQIFYTCLFLVISTTGCDSKRTEQVVTVDSKPKKSPSNQEQVEAPDAIEKTIVSNESDKLDQPKHDIFRSAGSGDIDAVKYHLSNEVELNARDKTGKTPLLWAIRSKEHEVVYYLLDNGADPNIGDKNKVTPLFWAVRMRRPELVTALMNKGADIKLRDSQGKDVFDYAKDDTIIEILRRHNKK